MEDFDEYLYDDDGNPIRCPEFEREENPFEGVEDNKDIFHVKGDGYDVTLSLASGLITWKNVNPAGKIIIRNITFRIFTPKSQISLFARSVSMFGNL